MTKEKTRGRVLAVALVALMIASVLGILSATSGGSSRQSISAAISINSEVYLVPQHSRAPFCKTADVEIRVNAENFQAGQIKLIYESTCADVTNWVPNTTDFPIGTWNSDTSGEEWITFSAMAPLSGDYLIGTLTIHCVSEVECTTALDFIEDPATGSALFDSSGSEIPATWTDGTFQCCGPQLCTIPDPPSHHFGSVPICETRTWDFQITNCGSGVLEWTVSDDQWWITVNPASGTTTTETDTVTVEISTCDLECEQTYTGELTVDSNGGSSVGSITVHVTCEENEVYFRPQHSTVPPHTSRDVEIRVNATNFMGGQIKLIYGAACVDVTDWVLNTADFPMGTWESDTPGEEWITFTALGSLTGDYLIGTLTIHCISDGECITALDFIEDPATGSALFDDSGNEILATWTDGTRECKGLCGDVAPCPDCDYIVSMGDVILLLSYVGHPGEYQLCCEWCGDVAPCPVSDGMINMGDIILLLSYVGHPGEYQLCCG